MTYSLFELAKEKAEEMVLADDDVACTPAVSEVAVRAKKEKKEMLTKQQKRRLADRSSECVFYQQLLHW